VLFTRADAAIKARSRNEDVGTAQRLVPNTKSYSFCSGSIHSSAVGWQEGAPERNNRLDISIGKVVHSPRVTRLCARNILARPPQAGS
jgi:hypothetical protein